MAVYPKKILSLEEQIEAYRSAGLDIESAEELKKILTTVGYYRLRGYCCQFYNNSEKRFVSGIKLGDIIRIYEFDRMLSQLVFGYLTQIEVALRARFVDSLIIHGDPLIWSDSSVFDDKAKHWQNFSSVASEISRSNEVFIYHNYEKHDGMIPIWAAVEVMSFGTLSKFIKNLKTGAGSSYTVLADYYTYTTPNGRKARPSKNMLSSWIHSASVLRNICAHNSRIYNRTIYTVPDLLYNDAASLKTVKYSGLYQIVLAMKYLRPDNESWNEFSCRLVGLIERYNGVVELGRIGFPDDWKAHLVV